MQFFVTYNTAATMTSVREMMCYLGTTRIGEHRPSLAARDISFPGMLSGVGW